MRKVLCCALGLSLFTATFAFATAYQIPVQSYDSVAKSGANIASASGADAAYFNPAGAAWVKDGWLVQVDATYLRLTAAEYRDYRTGNNPYGINFDGTAQAENYFIPTFFLLSPTWKDFRFGFSVTTPNGLAKRWEDSYPGIYSHKFSLQVYEFNPTLTYAFNDKFSIAGGARMLYTSATVINQGGKPYLDAEVSRYMNGSSIDWGYNLAADFRPTKELNLAVTFRSNVDLDITGNGIMKTDTAYVPNPYYPYYGGNPYLGPFPTTISSRGSISIPSPAVLSFSGAYNFGKTTAELTVNRIYWSKLKSLDFQYNGQVGNTTGNPADGGSPVFNNFTEPETRDWHDTTTVRLGLEYEATKKLTLMAGIAYSESPAPSNTVGFELPDSDTWAFSVGGRYAFTDNLDIGLGVLYDTATTRWIGSRSGDPTKPNDSGMNGEITNEAALLVTLGLQYRF